VNPLTECLGSQREISHGWRLWASEAHPASFVGYNIRHPPLTRVGMTEIFTACFLTNASGYRLGVSEFARTKPGSGTAASLAVPGRNNYVRPSGV
jgi:hypothetical protein